MMVSSICFWGLLTMDRFGSIDRDDDQEVAAATDAAVEAPPAIGTDERRMHVRAYNYWVSLLDGRAYPAIEDLKPEDTDFASNGVLLDFTSGAENPMISFLGEALRTECDLPEDVRSTADVPPRSLLSRLTDHYLQIIANRAPIGFEAEFVNHRGFNTMYRGILMPFSSDDDTIDFIYGVINWKEVADATLSGEIVDEVERAMQAATPRKTAPTAIWADGPSATHTMDEDEDEDEGFDDAIAELPAFEPDGTEGLGDWLAAARDFAEVAKSAEGRSRAALYSALGQAYDFALVTEESPDDYAELLDESGLSAQDRAPMTPIVKLVFGIDYDKTRLAEYASALTYGRRHNLARGGMTEFLQKYSGGLKALVAAERAERRPATSEPKLESRAVINARKMEPMAILEFASDEEFVVLVARRVDAHHVALLGKSEHDAAMVEKALRRLKR
jgi:hypothetical protein